MKITIWTGPALETWGPDSFLNGGIGGSETAAARVAHHLQASGHEVEIIGQVKPGTATNWPCGTPYRQVSYNSHESYLRGEARIECDVFISSRDLGAKRLLRPATRWSVLWMHDLHVGDDWREEMSGYDQIFCLSKWACQVARNTYPHVPREKFVVTRNGIEPQLFLCEGEDPLDLKSSLRPVHKPGPTRVIYSSSPDRGLDRLLDFWPKIRTFDPAIELHVYYGFNNWEAMANLTKDKAVQMTVAFNKDRLLRMDDLGVIAHGRVGQVELAKAFLASHLWLYPTNFLETSCITAMEAQAAGAFPITSGLGALLETAQRGWLIAPPNTTKAYERSFLEAVENSLGKSADYVEQTRLEVRSWALQNLSWDKVATSWDQIFSDKIPRP